MSPDLMIGTIVGSIVGMVAGYWLGKEHSRIARTCPTCGAKRADLEGVS